MLESILLPFFVGVLSNVATHVVIKSFVRRDREDAPPDHRQSLELLGWSLVPLLVVLGVLALLEYRWPLSPWGKSLVVAGSFVLSLALVAAARWLSTAGALLLVITACFAGFYLLDQFLPTFLALDCPGEVESRSSLSGRVVDPDWRVYVLVIPELGGSFMHPVPIVDKDGSWSVNCPFGGGASSRFRILALGAPRERVEKLSPALGKRPEELHRHLLDAAYRSSTCLVTKR